MQSLHVSSEVAERSKRDKNLVLTVTQVRALLGLSATSIYRALHKGDIPAERVGSTWLIPKDAFFQKFGSPPAAAAQPMDAGEHEAGMGVAAPDGPEKVPVKPMIRSAAMGENKRPEYVTAQQAAEILGFREGRTVKRKLLDELRYRMNGREYLIELDSVYEYIERTTLGRKDT